MLHEQGSVGIRKDQLHTHIGAYIKTMLRRSQNQNFWSIDTFFPLTNEGIALLTDQIIHSG